MTPAELAAVRSRLDAATPGPRGACGDNRGGCQCGMIWGEGGETYLAKTISHDVDAPTATLERRCANALFIGAAPSDVRALLAEVERLRGADVRCAECEKEVRDLRSRISWLELRVEDLRESAKGPRF